MCAPIIPAKEYTAMAHRLQTICLAALAHIAVSACGEKPSEPPAAPAEPAAPTQAPAAPAAPAAPPSVELPAVPNGAKVFFIEPTDGAKIHGPLANGKVDVSVKMGTEGIAVKPAGQIEAGSGHHHLLVDVPPDPEGTVVAKDEQHIHFGQGQTEAKLSLAPGDHTLQLQFADGIHRSYGPKLASTIKISVAEGTPATAAADKTKAEPAAANAKPKKKH
jgi:hypothetical protein